MLGDDEAALRLFKQCLDLDPESVDALLRAERDPDTRDTVRALLRADQEPDEVENGFGHGALELLADAATNDPTEDVLPQSIGPYRVIRMAGAGSTAIVYEALEAVPRRRVAVKVARATLDPDRHPHFEAEAHALSQVRDEAVPVVYQVGSMVGLPWLAMEWVEGAQLNPTTIQDPLITLIAVSRGIAAAHNAGVTHGDLSPANILLTTTGPKLVDFGLAGGDGTTGATGGTKGYRSDEPLPPEHADQYALGRIIRACNRGTDSALDAIADAATGVEYGSVRALWVDLCNRRDDRPLTAQPDTPVQSIVRWTRRFRAPLIGVAATAMTALLSVVFVQQVQRQSAENAIRHLNADAMADLEAVLGQPTEGLDIAVARWLEDPRWVGTPAVGRAWLQRARLMAIAGELQASEDAAAQAFVVAIRDEDRTQAAEVLADRFIRDAQWSSLLRLADSTGSQAWRMAAFAGQRDIPNAALAARDTPFFSLLSQWSNATRTQHKPTQLFDGPEPGTFFLADHEAGFFRLTRAEATLPIIASAPMGPDRYRTGLPIAMPNGRIAENLDASSMVISRMARHGDTLIRTAEVSGPTHAIGVAQLENDGAIRTFGGYGFPSRDLFELTAEGHTVAHSATSAARSDVGPILAIHLPDGSPGLIAAVGAWRAYDLRMYRAEGALELMDREELGTVTALQVISSNPLVIAVGASDIYGNSQILGADTPFGQGRGIHLREVTQTGLIDRGFYPGDAAFKQDETLGQIVPGDFDGDGLTDMAVRISTPRGSVMWVLRNNGDGYDPLIIGDVVPLFAQNIDDDSADELFARLDGDNYHLWTFGVGEQTLPSLPAVSHAPLLAADVPESLGAVIQLSDLGLDRAAATLAEHRATRLPQEHQQASQHLRGMLWQRVGDDQRAEVHLQAALDLSRGSDETVRIRLAEVQASQLKFSEARDTLEPVEGTQPADLRRRIDRAADFPVQHLRFPEAFDRMTLHNVDGIRTPVVGPHVDMDITANGGILFSADVEVMSTEFSMSYTIDHKRTELATGVYISLRDEDGEIWVEATQSGGGGGREINLDVGCRSEKLSALNTRPIANELDVGEHVAVHLSYNQRAQQARCRARNALGPTLDHTWTLPPPSSRYLTLEVRTPPVTTDVGTRAEVRLSELVLRGFRFRNSPDSPRQDAGKLLVRGDYADAADAYADAGFPEWEALAHLDGGNLSAATAWLQNNPDHPLTQRLHRTRREVGPVLAAFDPDGYAARVDRDFSSGLRYTEAPDVAAVLLHPALDTLVPSTEALCQLLRRRAGVLTLLDRTGPSLAVLDRIGQQPFSPELEYCKVAADTHAAELFVGMGRPLDAQERIQRAIATSSIPDITRERLRRHALLKDQVEP